MQERIMPVKSANELPELVGGTCNHACAGLFGGDRLLRVGNHCRDSPFLSAYSYDAGRHVVGAGLTFNQTPTFQEECHAQRALESLNP
jgi:hypothetical protein